MGNLLSCQSLSKSYSHRPLFEDISFGVEEGDIIGLIGPNGAGKSTLLKILAGLVEPDSGEVVKRRGLRIAHVSQNDDLSIGSGKSADISSRLIESASFASFSEYERASMVDKIMKEFAFKDFDEQLLVNLSGGWKKRLALACGLVQDPELLLLDEPTNHLDIQSVLWLEAQLLRFGKSMMIITHDRAFLENIATRIIELNPRYPQGFLSVKGAYSAYLEERAAKVSEQEHLEQALASRLRREIAWLKRGARGRQSKSSARIENVERIKSDFEDVRQRNSEKSLSISFQDSGRHARELLVLESCAKNFGEKSIFKDLDLILSNKSRLGVAGINGSGKTTLLKIITGELEPDQGKLQRADHLKIVYFDQNRSDLALDDNMTLLEALAGESNTVEYQGRNIHAATWARRFLFKDEQMRQPLRFLSGGEKSRISIANIMRQVADILILDEPTNDLDIGSLEVLQSSLAEFPGAVVLVTHDRLLLDAITNEIIVLDGKGGCSRFCDWEQFEQTLYDNLEPAMLTSQDPIKDPRKGESNAKKRIRSGLSAPERRALESLPEKIEALEEQIAALDTSMHSPEIVSDFSRLSDLMNESEKLKSQLESLYSKWTELEEKNMASQGF